MPQVGHVELREEPLEVRRREAVARVARVAGQVQRPQPAERRVRGQRGQPGRADRRVRQVQVPQRAERLRADDRLRAGRAEFVERQVEGGQRPGPRGRREGRAGGRSDAPFAQVQRAEREPVGRGQFARPPVAHVPARQAEPREGRERARPGEGAPRGDREVVVRQVEGVQPRERGEPPEFLERLVRQALGQDQLAEPAEPARARQRGQPGRADPVAVRREPLQPVPRGRGERRARPVAPRKRQRQAPQVPQVPAPRQEPHRLVGIVGGVVAVHGELRQPGQHRLLEERGELGGGGVPEDQPPRRERVERPREARREGAHRPRAGPLGAGELEEPGEPAVRLPPPVRAALDGQPAGERGPRPRRVRGEPQPQFLVAVRERRVLRVVRFGRREPALDAQELGLLGPVVLLEPVGVHEARRVVVRVAHDRAQQCVGVGHGVEMILEP